MNVLIKLLNSRWGERPPGIQHYDVFEQVFRTENFGSAETEIFFRECFEASGENFFEDFTNPNFDLGKLKRLAVRHGNKKIYISDIKRVICERIHQADQMLLVKKDILTHLLLINNHETVLFLC